MTRDWRDISYLTVGNPRQRRAHEGLCKLGILHALADFDPVLASTVNIDIDIESSDLDIICEAVDLQAFEARLRELYGAMRGFVCDRVPRDPEAVVASFWFEGWEYEVFGQALPVDQQNAYKHLTQTSRVIARGGERWREAIRGLKRRGLKTEPAVAYCLRLEGDPYIAVLALEGISDDALDLMLAQGPHDHDSSV